MSKKRMLREDVRDAVILLDKLRQNNDTPEARQFFNEILYIREKNENGLNFAIKLYHNYINKGIKVTEELEDMYNFVERYGTSIYFKFVQKIKEADEKSSVYAEKPRKDAFLFAVSFIYSALQINDKESILKLYEELTEKINKINNVTYLALMSIAITLVLSLLSFRIILSTVVLHSIILSVLYMISEWKFRYARQNARDVGDVKLN
jgi:hypothetical protein